jgi:hypothetical protein
MSLFFGVIFLSSFLHIDFTMLALPVIWFFSFFDTFNLRSLPPERFADMPDRFLFGLESLSKESFAPLFRNGTPCWGES